MRFLRFFQPPKKSIFKSQPALVSLLLTESLQPALTLPCQFSDGVPVWTVPKSPSGEQLKNGGLTPLRSAEPSPALRKRSLSHGAEVRNVTSRCQLSPLPLFFISTLPSTWSGLRCEPENAALLTWERLRCCAFLTDLRQGFVGWL